MEHYIGCLKGMDTKKILVKLFGEILNVMLKEIGEYNATNELIFGGMGEKRTLLNISCVFLKIMFLYRWEDFS